MNNSSWEAYYSSSPELKKREYSARVSAKEYEWSRWFCIWCIWATPEVKKNHALTYDALHTSFRGYSLRIMIEELRWQEPEFVAVMVHHCPAQITPRRATVVGFYVM